jgi:hypothetical protein
MALNSSWLEEYLEELASNGYKISDPTSGNREDIRFIQTFGPHQLHNEDGAPISRDITVVLDNRSGILGIKTQWPAIANEDDSEDATIDASVVLGDQIFNYSTQIDAFYAGTWAGFDDEGFPMLGRPDPRIADQLLLPLEVVPHRVGDTSVKYAKGADEHPSFTYALPPSSARTFLIVEKDSHEVWDVRLVVDGMVTGNEIPENVELTVQNDTFVHDGRTYKLNDESGIWSIGVQNPGYSELLTFPRNLDPGQLIEAERMLRSDSRWVDLPAQIPIIGYSTQR